MVMSLIAKQLAKKASKNIGKKAKDLGTPSSVSTPGSGKSLRSATPANEGNVRSSQVAAKTAAGFDEALSKKQKELKTYNSKRDSLTGVDKIKFIAKNQTTVKDLKASIADMKKRGGPRVEKMGGGSLKKVPAGNKGLSKLPTTTRNKMGFKKAGGPVVKKMGGGSMNPKKYMNKGGVVKRRSGGKIGDGNSFVADCYK